MAAHVQKVIDPFYEPPLPRAYYHPSPQTAINNQHPKMLVSPQRVIGDPPQKPLTPEEEAFLRGSYQYSIAPYKGLGRSTQEADRYGRIPLDDDSGKFNESWPDSERLSTLPSIPDPSPPEELQTKSRGSISTIFSSPTDGTTLSDEAATINDIRSRLDFSVPEDPKIKKSGIKRSGDQGDHLKGSTLSKYIERFRHGKPMSKEERINQKAATAKDFWWLNSTQSSSVATPPSSSTPKEEGEEHKSRAGHIGGRSQKTKSRLDEKERSKLTKDNLAAAHLLAPSNPWRNHEVEMDEESRLLQKKADQLLEQTASTTLSSLEVSTQGLGSTVTSEMSAVSSEPYRPKFIPQHHNSSEVPRARKPQRREDDILYQWRLRRRLETAREGAVFEGSTARERIGSEPVTNMSKPTDANFDSRLAAFRHKLTAGSPSDTATSNAMATGKATALKMAERATDSGARTAVPMATFTPAPQCREKDQSLVKKPSGVFQNQQTVAETCICQKQEKLNQATAAAANEWGENQPTPGAKEYSKNKAHSVSGSHSENVDSNDEKLLEQTPVNKIVRSSTESEAESEKMLVEDSEQKMPGKSLSKDIEKSSGISDKDSDITGSEEDRCSDEIMIPERDMTEQPKLKPKEKDYRKNIKGKRQHSVEKAQYEHTRKHEEPGLKREPRHTTEIIPESSNDRQHKVDGRNHHRERRKDQKPGTAEQRCPKTADRKVMVPQTANKSPRRRGSPKRIVTSAIGQAVRDHFLSGSHTESDGNDQSSCDSDAAGVQDSWDLVNVAAATSSGNTAQPAASDSEQVLENAGAIETAPEILQLSDGEEFADDELLIDLRQRRARHLERLGHIDLRLAVLGESG